MLDSKKSKVAGVLSAALVAATPGIYSAWESAKQSYTLSNETLLRDKQESALQDNVRANTKELHALRSACATHKDLLSLVIRLKNDQRITPPEARTRHRSFSRGLGAFGSGNRRTSENRTPEGDAVTDTLRKKVERADRAKQQIQEARKLRTPLVRPQEQRALMK